MTEQEIQTILFKNYVAKGHNPIAPNCMALGYEADLLSVTGSGFAYEFEIKVSHSDFRADANKVNKHWIYSKGDYPHRTPSRFYYVCPDGLIQVEEVPDHAGLIYVSRTGKWVHEVKSAPRLHKEKMDPSLLYNITASLMYKVFNGVTKSEPMRRTK